MEAMKRSRQILTMACILASLIGNADEPSATKTEVPADKPVAAALLLLQGTWEGGVVGEESREKITITITGDSLHFHRDTNFWFETTITLDTDKDPDRLKATIKGCPESQASSIGEVVPAMYKVENGTLTLVPLGGSDEDTPKSFEAAEEKGMTRYELRKVKVEKEKAKSSKVQRTGGG